jgi:hypothetical protein
LEVLLGVVVFSLVLELLVSTAAVFSFLALWWWVLALVFVLVLLCFLGDFGGGLIADLAVLT